MRRTSALAPLVALGLALALWACAGDERKPARTTPTPPAPSAELRALRAEEYGWIALRDLGATARTLSAWLRQPAPRVEAQLLTTLGVDPRLREALDPTRAIVVALLDPHRRGLPLVVAVPIRAEAQFLARVAALHPPATAPALPGVRVFEQPEGRKLYVRVDGGYAYLAYDLESARAARELLAPRLGRPPAMVVFHATPRIVSKLDALEQSFADFLSMTTGIGDPRNEYETRGLHRVAAYLSDASALEARLDLGRRGLVLALRMEGKQGGPWATYVAGRAPLGDFGARLIPRDAVLAHLTRASAKDREADADALEIYLAAIAPSTPTRAERDRWHAAIAAVTRTLAEESVYAVWPAAGGGVGAGGAFRVSDPAAAREAARAFYREIRPALGPAAARVLSLDAARHRFTARVRPAAQRLYGAEVDLVELTPAFPRGEKDARKVVQALFGPRITLALAWVGDTAVWAMGRDWEPRLAALVRAARGEQVPSLIDDPAFAEALRDGAGRVSLVYVPTAPLARMIASLVEQTGIAGAPEGGMLAPFLAPERELSAIVVATRVRPVKGGVAYELVSRIPPAALTHLGDIGGAMWRAALAPLLGAPTIPPLPVPPANLTPPARPGTTGTATAGGRE